MGWFGHGRFMSFLLLLRHRAAPRPLYAAASLPRASRSRTTAVTNETGIDGATSRSRRREPATELRAATRAPHVVSVVCEPTHVQHKYAMRLKGGAGGAGARGGGAGFEAAATHHGPLTTRDGWFLIVVEPSCS